MKRKASEKLFDGINYFLLFILTVITLYPFWYIFIYSISDSAVAGSGGVTLWPVGINFNNYSLLFSNSAILHAAFISTARTVLGTFIGTFSCAMFAYVLTKELLPFRKMMYRMVVFSMFFSSGLVPWYILMKDLHLKNNFLIYILPYILTAFYLVLIKTYIESLPAALEESALVDGANYLNVFFRIILPLTTPVLAAVAIFIAVDQWSRWQDNLFLAPQKNLQTLQLLLYNMLANQEADMLSIKTKMNSGTMAHSITPAGIRMSITMIVSFPILLVYPLMQRYFVKGIMLGAVKG